MGAPAKPEQEEMLLKKTLIAGMLVLALVAVGCDDGDDATEAPAAVEEQSVDDGADAVEENAEDAADAAEQDARDKADEVEADADALEDDLEEKADEVEASLRAGD